MSFPPKNSFRSLLLALVALGGGVGLFAIEMPRRADDFVDAMGLNAHLDDIGDVYNESLTGQLGIRHYRSNVKPGSATQTARFTGLFSNYGIRINLVCDSVAYTPAQYRDFMTGAMFESVEGLNEPDYFGPRSYGGFTDNPAAHRYDATLAFQRELQAVMMADAATRDKQVLSPAMSNPINSRYLRPMTADVIAMHNYPDQQLPTANFLASFILPMARVMLPPGEGVLPTIVTETGYRSGSEPTDISPLAARKYIPRTFAEYFRLGVARTYLYELADKGGAYHFGLVDNAFSPKPAYVALQNLIGLLREATWNATTKTFTKPQFNPGVLDYTMTGGSPKVHHVLLQKSTGAFYLLLWQEVSSYDTAQRADIPRATVPVTLGFNLPLSSAALYQLQSAAPVATYGAVRTITVNVPDEVVVLRLNPGSGAANAAGDPEVSVMASDAAATVTPLDAGAFTISRVGGLTAPLTVYYTLAGTGSNGLDYEPLAGSVLIPAGASTVNVPVVPRNNSIIGRKDVVLTLAANAGYRTAAAATSTVFINPSRVTVADFETGIAGWGAAARSSISWERASTDGSAGALKWVYIDNGVDRWNNNIAVVFATPQDWSAVSRLQLRIKEGAGNPASNMARPISFTWVNNGVKVSGTAEVAKLPLSCDDAFRTVSLELGDFPRDRVTALQFYIDGSIFQTGTHTFYFDNLAAITDTNGVIDDMEQNAAAQWSSSERSTVQVDDQHADTGRYALKWVYNDDGATRWNNIIKLRFAQPHDLSGYSTLCVRFREESTNPASDTNSRGARVYLDWTNGGVRASTGGGVGSFPLIRSTTSRYRTVEIGLADYNRDNVNDLFFFVDGIGLATGPHTWYIDNVSVY